jgi:hypothetical protein
MLVGVLLGGRPLRLIARARQRNDRQARNQENGSSFHDTPLVGSGEFDRLLVSELIDNDPSEH